MFGYNFEGLKWSFEDMISQHIDKSDEHDRDFWMYQYGRCDVARGIAQQMGADQLQKDFTNFYNQIHAIIESFGE